MTSRPSRSTAGLKGSSIRLETPSFFLRRASPRFGLAFDWAAASTASFSRSVVNFGSPLVKSLAPSETLPETSRMTGRRRYLIRGVNQGARLPQHRGDGAAPIDGFRRKATMLQGVLIARGRAGVRSAVHPASAILHRRRLARRPFPRLRSAARAQVHAQLALHGVVPLFWRVSLPLPL